MAQNVKVIIRTTSQPPTLVFTSF